MTVWWTAHGIIHIEYLQRGLTINSALYCSQIETVQQKLAETRASLVNRKGVILLHDCEDYLYILYMYAVFYVYNVID